MKEKLKGILYLFFLGEYEDYGIGLINSCLIELWFVIFSV